MNTKNSLPASIDDIDEVPPLTDAFFKRAVHRVDLKPVGKKPKINIALDPDIVAFFKTRAGGRGYQTLINASLREIMREQALAETPR